MKIKDIILFTVLILIIVGAGIFIHNAKAPDRQIHMWTPTPYKTKAPAAAADGARSAPLGAAPAMVTPTAVPTPTINPRLLIRYSQEVSQGGRVYEQCLIKGNINSKGDRIYHVPGSASYDATKIDTSQGERWFCTEYDAIRAGWHAPGQ